MKPSLTLHRVYFFVVVWFTLWVGYFGFFRPEEILRALPWPVPPLHARFIGAFYLSATVFLVLALCARTLLEVRTIVLMAFTWTGWLLGITFLHWQTFDFSRPQPWFWVVAYVLFPIAAAWLAWAGPGADRPTQGAITERWIVFLLRLQGGGLLALAAACFLAPAWIVTLWPWKISPFLAQVYSGPVIAYAVGSLVLAARRNWPETMIPAIGTLVFAGLALIGSARHLALFTPGSPSKILWFTLLGLVALFAAGLVWRALQHRRHSV
jgi:hypothetical protein